MTHTLPPECLPLARYRKGDEEYVVLATLDGSAGPRAVCHAVKSDVVVTFYPVAFHGNAALALSRTSPAIAARNEVNEAEAGWSDTLRELDRKRQQAARLERERNDLASELAGARADRAEVLRQLDAVLLACTYPGSHQHAVQGEAPVEKVKRALERIAGERDALRARIGDVEQTARLAMARASDRERERDVAQRDLEDARARTVAAHAALDAAHAPLGGSVAERVERLAEQTQTQRAGLRDLVQGSTARAMEVEKKLAEANAHVADLEKRLAFDRDVLRETRESLARVRSERDALEKRVAARDASPTRKPLSEDEAVDLLDATTDRHEAAFDLLARGGRLVPGPFAVEDVRLAAIACGASEVAVDAALRLLGRSL